jgi:hypothetical protein
MMDLQLHRSYTASDLGRLGLTVPSDTGVWFQLAMNDAVPTLFLTPDDARCWCYPPTDDRNLCFFFSPFRLRLGVDRCRNKWEMLNFHAALLRQPSVQRRVHLLASLLSDEWWYLGQTSLGSGFGNNSTLNQFEIGLDEKLPEQLWHQFGGYRGWLICTGKDQLVIQEAADVDDLLENHWGFRSPQLEITRYADDALFAMADLTGQAALIYRDGSRELHTVNMANTHDDSLYEFVLSHGQPIEVPKQWIIPRREAINLIRRFLDTGVPLGLVDG